MNLKIKKITCNFFLLISIFTLFTSCSFQAEPQDYLLYQIYPFNVEVEIKNGNNNYISNIKMVGLGSGTISFTSPQTLNGVEFKVENGNVSIAYSKLNISLSQLQTKNGVDKFISIFSLTPEEMVKAEMSEQNGTKLNIVTFNHNDSEVKTYINSNTGLPIRIDTNMYEQNISVNIKKITKEEIAK